jgi:hypothetical protein
VHGKCRVKKNFEIISPRYQLRLHLRMEKRQRTD